MSTDKELKSLRLKKLINEDLKEFRAKKLNEAKDLSLIELNAALDINGAIEFTPNDNGVALMGDDDQLILACSIIDYQTRCKHFTNGLSVQFMGLDGELFDIQAKGKVIVVSDYDAYLNMLEDYEQ